MQNSSNLAKDCYKIRYSRLDLRIIFDLSLIPESQLAIFFTLDRLLAYQGSTNRKLKKLRYT